VGIVLDTPDPSNGSINIELTPTLSINISHNDSDTMQITFRSNSSGNWVDFSTTSGTNDTYTANGTNFTAYTTKYWWSVNVSDEDDNWVNATYHFTTHPDWTPSNPTNALGSIQTTTSIDITWTKGTYATNTLIIEKTGSYPTSRTDGTEIYNSTGTSHTDNSYSNNSYYTLYSYNDSDHTYSSGVNLEIGSLTLYCYEEDTNEPLTFDIFVSNLAGTDTYESLNNDNPLIIDIDDLPLGDVIIRVDSSSSYDNRTETFSGYSNISNESTTYIYLEVSPDNKETTNITCTNETGVNSYPMFSLTGDMITIPADAADSFTSITVNYTYDTYRAQIYEQNLVTNTDYTIYTYLSNQTDSLLYLITVINELDDPVDDATVYFKRYINDTSGYHNVSIRFTDGNGECSAYLIPDETYLIEITATNYQTEYASFTPRIDVRTKTFQLEFEEEEFTNETTYHSAITFNGHVSGTTLYVNFSDTTLETTNTTIRVYELDSDTNTSNLIHTDTRTADYDFQFNVNIDTNYTHQVVLYVTHPIFGTDLVDYFYISPQQRNITSADRFNDLFDLNYGTNPLGWSNVAAFFLMVFGLFSFGQRGSGISLFLTGGMLLSVNTIIGLNVIGTVIPIFFLGLGILVLWSQSSMGGR
jgi:hypothetical protein